MPPDNLYDALFEPANPRERVHRVASRFGIDPNIAEDFTKVVNLESGASHYDRAGRVKRGPVTRSGDRAIGATQIMPKTAKAVDPSLDPFKEDDNYALGLRYFAQGGADPTERRLRYFGGPGAANRYRRTGRIPKIDDRNLTAAQYVQATGGTQQQRPPANPYDALFQDSGQSPADKTELKSRKEPPESPVTPASSQSVPYDSLFQVDTQPAPPAPRQGLFLPPGQVNDPTYQPKFGLGQTYREWNPRAAEAHEKPGGMVMGEFRRQEERDARIAREIRPQVVKDYFNMGAGVRQEIPPELAEQQIAADPRLREYIESETQRRAKLLEERERQVYRVERGFAPPLGVADKLRELKDKPEQLVPFLSSIPEIDNLRRIGTAAEKLERNERLTKEEEIQLREFIAASKQDKTLLYKVADVISALPAFAGEIATTGGFYSAGRKAALKGLEKLITKEGIAFAEKKLGTRIALKVGTGLVGAAAQTIPAGATRIPAGVVFRQQEGSSFAEALRDTLADQFIEVASERAGGLLSEIPLPQRLSAIRDAITSRWIQKVPGRTAEQLQKLVEKTGWHGPLGEIFEERVGDIARYGVGLQASPVPTLQQLAVEGLAFSVPSAGAAVATKLTSRGGESAPDKVEAPSATPEVSATVAQRSALPQEAGREPLSKSSETVPTKTIDRMEGSTRVVQYELPQESGPAIGILLTIRPDGQAQPLIGPIEEGVGIDTSKRAEIGTQAVLALKRHIQEQHPEIKSILFDREGSTGGEFGRRRTITKPTISESQVTPQKPTVETPAEIKTQPSATESQLTTERKVTDEVGAEELRRVTAPLPETASALREEKQATPKLNKQLSDWGGRLKSIAQSKDLNALQALSDEMAAHKDDPRVARLRTSIQDELARARQPEIPESPESGNKITAERAKLSKTAQKALIQAETAEGKTVRQAPAHRIGAPKPDASRNSLEQQVRAYGGVKDDASQAYKGELGWLKESGKRGTVNQSGGLSVEDMATRLAQDGYGKGVWWEGAPNNVNPQAFLQAVMDDTRGTKQYSTERDVIEDDPDVKAWDALVEGAGAELIGRVSSGRATAADIVTLTREAQANGLSDRALDAFVAGLQRTIQEKLPAGTQEGEGYSLDEDGTLLDPNGKPLFARQLEFTNEGLIQQEARSAPSSTQQREQLRREQSERDEAADPKRAAARRLLEDIKRRGMSIDEYARQGVLFGSAPSAEEIALLKEVERGTTKETAEQTALFTRKSGAREIVKPSISRTQNVIVVDTAIMTALVRAHKEWGAGIRGIFLNPRDARQFLKKSKALELADLAHLIGEIRKAAATADGSVVITTPEELAHERFHLGSEQGSAGKSLKDRHGDFDSLIYNSTYVVMRSNLMSHGYRGEAVMVEESAAFIARGDYDALGVTRKEALDWLALWFKSFIKRNGEVSVERFQELEIDAQKSLATAINKAAAEKTGERTDEGIRGVQERRESGTGEGRAPPTESEAFKRWFGDSKVVDEDGKPLVVYHGTPDPSFKKFSLWLGAGHWFGSTPEIANEFAQKSHAANRRPAVIPVYLSIQNPKEFHGWTEYVEAADATGKQSIPDREATLRRRLMRQGFDGIVIRDSDTDQGGKRDDWVAFKPTQIKSATGNRGTFDPNDPNILFARSGDPWANLTELSAELERLANELSIPSETPTPKVGERSFPKTAEAAGYQGGTDRDYSVLTDKASIDQAKREIARVGADRAAADLAHTEDVGKPEIATGILLMQHYEQRGEISRAVNVASDVARKLTQAGQAVQAASIISRLSPEGVLLHAQKLLKGAPLAEETAKTLVQQAKAVTDAEKLLAEIQKQRPDIFGPNGEILPKPSQSRITGPRSARAKIGTLHDRLVLLEQQARERMQARAATAKVETARLPEKGQRGAAVSPASVAADLSDLVIIGAAKLARKGITRAVWLAEMAKEAGTLGRRDLRKLYRQSYEMYERERKQFLRESRERGAVRQAAKAGEPAPVTPRDYDRIIAERLDAQTAARKARTDLARSFENLNKSSVVRGLEKARDVWNLSRSLVTSLDLSAAGRQGKMGLVTHPKAWLRGVGRQFKALSTKQYERMISEMQLDPDYKYAQRFKLKLSSIAGTEEVFQSEFASKVPWVKHSQQAYDTMLDTLRFGWFKALLQKYRAAGINLDDLELKERFIRDASLINNFTGRGGGATLDRIGPTLSAFYFSPRFWASRLKVLSMPLDPRMYGMGRNAYSKQARVDAWKTLFGFYGLMAAQIGLARLLGATVSFDPDDDDFIFNPDNPDFMKVRFGDTHIDFSAGLQTHMRVAARLAKTFYLREFEGSKPRKGPLDILGQYSRGKESPGVSLLHDLFFSTKKETEHGTVGTNFAGQPVFLLGEPGKGTLKRIQSSAFTRQIAPIILQDALEAYTDSISWKEATLGIAASMVGEGANVYKEKFSEQREKWPMQKELDRLKITINPPQRIKPGKYDKFKAETEDEYQARRQKEAEAIKLELQKLEGQSYFKRLSPQDQEKEIRAAIRVGRAAVRPDTPAGKRQLEAQP